MKITCTGRKVNLKDAFIQRVETKLAKLDKFFSDSAEANVTVTVEKDWQTVEVTVKDKGLYEPCREIGRPYGRCVRRGGRPADAAHR